MRSGSVAGLEKVPCFLVLNVNGNAFDSGSAHTDASIAFRSAGNTVRYSVHFVKEGYSLPDKIRYLPNFHPRSLQPFCTSQNDLGTAMDAACVEFLAVGKASTERNAALRRSNKLKFRSSAALSTNQSQHSY